MNAELNHILGVVTQGSPMMLVDRVVDIHPRERIRGVKCVTRSECRGPSSVMVGDVFPSAFLLEGMVQLASVLIFTTESFDPETHRLHMVGAEKVKVRSPITAGDRVEYDLKVTQHRSNIWRFRCFAEVDGAEVVTLELLVALVSVDEFVTA